MKPGHYMNARLRAALRRLAALHEAAERSAWAPAEQRAFLLQAAIAAERARDAGLGPAGVSAPAAAPSCPEQGPAAGKQGCRATWSDGECWWDECPHWDGTAPADPSRCPLMTEEQLEQRRDS